MSQVVVLHLSDTDFYKVSIMGRSNRNQQPNDWVIHPDIEWFIGAQSQAVNAWFPAGLVKQIYELTFGEDTDELLTENAALRQQVVELTGALNEVAEFKYVPWCDLFLPSKDWREGFDCAVNAIRLLAKSAITD